MSYTSLQDCLTDLERNKQLIRIREEVSPHLEMAAIQLRVHAAGGPALLFENVKGTKFRAASNIFGTIERSRFIFRDTYQKVQDIIALKGNPMAALRHPFKNIGNGLAALKSLPLKKAAGPVMAQQISIQDLPLIKHWPADGGAFITLPQVYTEDPDAPGIMKANLGMYRIQLNGNEYRLNSEIGLHYQIHRGIGIHQSKADKKGQPLKVSIFVGGPPAHTLAAVMPLPEGLSETTFAGLLGGRRFRYTYDSEGYAISTEADFVITGEIHIGDTKPEGPFGDHLGYYSLTHPFPVMKVRRVYARQGAIWPFTVVGRPPQEDTSFGALIHELTGDAIPQEIPGLKEVNAVDAAGVHPLLLAIGSERYTPYAAPKAPAEILTLANRILGTGQLSLAKFLFITADDTARLHTHDIQKYFEYVLQRADWRRDVHFQTNTTIDTLDYSGTGLNSGSKVVIAAYGDAIRSLAAEAPQRLKELNGFGPAHLTMPGVAMLGGEKFTNYDAAMKELSALDAQLSGQENALAGVALIILCDDPAFAAATLNNFLWITFTRANPSHDIYGIGAFTRFKHWGCTGPLVIDARIKPHHAPPLEMDYEVERSIDRLFARGGSLAGLG